MKQKIVWVVDDISASAELVVGFLERKFGDKIRVMHVYPEQGPIRRAFIIPNPSTLWCKRDGDVTPNIVISELISPEQLHFFTYGPQLLVGDLSRQGSWWRKPGSIQGIKQFAETYKLDGVAVVTRCFDWFSGLRDLTLAEAVSLEEELRKELTSNGITTAIAKYKWGEQSQALVDFMEKALAL